MTFAPQLVVLDLNLNGENGVNFIPHAHAANPDVKVVVLTAYGCPRSAAWAIRNGAADYIAKPVDADEIDHALQRAFRGSVPVPPSLLPPDEARNIHIVDFYEKNDCNVSQTARHLGMHRRTLQRMLERMHITATRRHSSRFGRAKRLVRLWSRLLSDWSTTTTR